MKKRWVLLFLVFTLFLSLFQCPAHAGGDPRLADSRTKPHTVVPEGVTEIDLRTFFGDAAGDISDAWVLRESIYAVLLWLEGDEGCEIILLDTQNGSLLSRTPVPYIGYSFVSTRPGWVDGVLQIMIWAWDEGTDESYPGRTYIKVSISPDGLVTVSGVTQSWDTLMPGGKTIIRKVEDGSLYAIDVAIGEEELLIQGVSKQEFFNKVPDERGKYVPSKAEFPDREVNPSNYGFLVYDPEDYLTGVRDFVYVTPLDDHRFAYGINAWEWEAGFGVYDLQTHTDHRITSDGYFFGEAGGYIFGSTLKANANTYETTALPEFLHPTLEFIYSIENDYLTHSISPDGKLLALAGRDYGGFYDRNFYGHYETEYAVTIIDMETCEIVKTYDIDNPFAEESSVAFYDDTRVMLFCGAKENGSAYIYLFNLEE